MAKLLRLILIAWGCFDVATGLLALVAPEQVSNLLWPDADADALVMIRRAGPFWLGMGIAQLAAGRRFPVAELLYIVAALRFIDGMADVAWLVDQDGFSTLGYLTIGPSPVLSTGVAVLAWQVARGVREPSREVR